MAKETKKEMVNHPAHYNRTKLECIDVMEDMITGWPAGTGLRLAEVLKYIWRHKDKGIPLENLKKAQFYLNREIAKLEQES